MPERRYPAAFETFWTAYPSRRPNPKVEAHATWSRIVRTKLATEDELLAAARGYAAECAAQGIEPKYVAQARNWLSKERWRDYPAPVEAAAAAPGRADVDAAHPLAAIAVEIGAAAWRSWIAPLVVEQGPDGTIVRAPSAFIAERVRVRHGEAIRRLLGRDVEVLP